MIKKNRQTKLHKTREISPRVIISTRLAIFVLFSLAGILTIYPTRILINTDQQLIALNSIRETSNNLNRIAFRILTVNFTSAEEKQFSESIHNYDEVLQTGHSILGEYAGYKGLLNLSNYTTPTLLKLDYYLNRLRDTDLSSGTMSLQERNFTIRQTGLDEGQSVTDYAMLLETITNLRFLIRDVTATQEEIITELSQEINENRESAFQKLSLALIVYFAGIGVAIVLASMNRIRRAQTAEKEAHERSEALETLVRVRTAALETQNRKLTDAGHMLAEKEKMTALGQVVSGVAHEVNTPLGVCVTATTYLADRLKDREVPVDRNDVIEVIRLILENVTRASNLIKGFKKVAVDEMDDDCRTFDIASYMQKDLLPGLKSMLRTHHHDIEYTGPESCLMYGYPGSMAQVITNLVMNASIHGYGKEPGGVIRIGLSDEDTGIALTVSDEGRGMNEKTRGRIFEPFFTTNRSEGGSGLGMMVVYNIINVKLNGDVQCHSIPGEGTVFTVKILKDSRTIREN